MSDENKQTVQDTFNVIARAQSLGDIQKGLSMIEGHSADERKELIEKIDTTIMKEFLDDMPSPTELEMVLAMSAMVGEAPDTEDLEMIQGILMVADAIVTEQGSDASPVLTAVLEKVGNLSDEDFNNPLTLLKSVVEGSTEGRQIENKTAENPFRKKYGGPNGQ